MTDTNLPATTQPQRTAITAGGNVGALIPQDIEQAFRIAQALAHSGMTPNGFKTPETCFVAIMAGAELGLPPFQSLQSFAIINGRPTMYGDALVAVIRTNGFTMREWYEGEGDDLTAFCEVKRPDNGDVSQGEFSVSDAKTAGLWKKGGPWTTSPKRMLKMRARAFAIRDGAADVLRGFSIREEVEDYDAPLPSHDKREGTGLLAKMEANQALAEQVVDPQGFGIRDIDKEAGEPAPAAEPKKRGRPRKEPESSAHNSAENAAEAEAGKPTLEQNQSVEANETPSEVGAENATAEDQEHPQPVPPAEEPPEPTPSAPSPSPSDESTSQSPTASQDGGAASASLFDDGVEVETRTLTAFEIFETASGEARGWDELRPAMVTLTHSDEWKAKPHDQKKARARVWELVQRWNEDGAKLDPAADAFLFQTYVSAMSDAEAITGTLEVAKGMKWYTDAPETYQASVRRFVAGRIEEIGRGA